MSVELDFDGIEKALRERGMFGDLPWNLLCYARTLKADRDAHLADLKEARELIRRLMQVSRPHVPRGIKQVYIEGDAFLERTK